MKVARVSWSLALAAAGALPSLAQAQGFGLNEIGSCAVGRGAAVTARPCEDASTLFWNPAGLVGLPNGLSLYGGAAGISIKGDFTQDVTGNTYEGDVPVVVPPHLFASYKFSPRVAAGVGMYVPYGLTSQWRDDFPGRFSAIKAALATIYVQPTLALDVVPGRFSVGGGPVFGHSTVELYQAIDLSQQVAARNPDGSVRATFAQLGIMQGTEFARARLKGDANAWGFQVGAHAKLTNTLDVGVRWLSALQFEYEDAEATFQQRLTRLTLAANNPLGLPAGTLVDDLVRPQFMTTGTTVGPLTARSGSSAIKHPGQLQTGIAWTGLARTTLSLDATFFTWSDFEVLPVAFGGENAPASRTIIEDYEDMWRFAVGLEHKFDDRFLGGFANNWAGRLGYSQNKSPAPDATVTPLLPEMDRRNYALGLGIPLSPRYGLDVAYLRVDTPGRRGRVVERASRDETAEELNTGFYRLTDVNILSLSLKAYF